MARLFRGIVAATLFSLLTSCALAAQPCNDPCRKPTSWFDFNVFTLTMEVPGSSSVNTWAGYWDTKSLDIFIDARTSDGKTAREGSIMVIGGQVMATKGDVAQAGYEVDALDAPVLMQKLVLNLLGAALPSGAEGLKGSRAVNHADDKTGIQFATASGQGFIAPPWRVLGKVRVVAPGKVEYALALKSGSKKVASGRSSYFEASFSGSLAKKTDAAIDDSTELTNWKVFGLGVVTTSAGTGTEMDYKASPNRTQYQKVGDIRKQIAVENDPGKPDPARDFTGFWREKCEDSFGLSIEHFGAEGLYSIAFCGPGGCDAVEEARKTYITGDRHIEVVSDDELVEIGRNGSRSRNVRCTRDPHPRLGK